MLSVGREPRHADGDEVHDQINRTVDGQKPVAPPFRNPGMIRFPNVHTNKRYGFNHGSLGGATWISSLHSGKRWTRLCFPLKTIPLKRVRSKPSSFKRHTHVAHHNSLGDGPLKMGFESTSWSGAIHGYYQSRRKLPTYANYRSLCLHFRFPVFLFLLFFQTLSLSLAFIFFLFSFRYPFCPSLS